MALDDLAIVIDVIDSFSDDIDELITDLEAVDVQADRVDDIFINLHTTGEMDVNELQVQLSTLNNKNVTVSVDTLGEQELFELASLKETVGADERVTVDIDVDGLGELGIAQAQQSTLNKENITVSVDTLGEQELFELAALKETVGADERVTVYIDVDGLGKLGIAQAQLASLQFMSAGDMNVNVGSGGGVNTPARGDMDDGGLLSLRMSDLHNVLAKLVPMIVTYIGALPAAIGGVVALGAAAVSAAAALGALGGLGMLGFALQAGDGDVMEGMSQIADRVQEDFMDAFEPLARELAPLFEDALDGLERTFDALASYGDVLIGLQDEARAFGQFFSEWIVGTAVSMGKLAEAAAPMFSIFGGIIERADLLEMAAGFLADNLPALLNFGAALAGIFTRIMQISEGFLIAATVMTQLIDAFFQVITLGGFFSEQVGVAIGTILGLITVLSILKSLFITSLIPAVGSFISTLFTLSGYNALAATTSYMLSSAIQFLRANLWTLVGTLPAVTGGLWLIGAAAGWIASQFLDTSSAIDEATSSLEEFQNVQGDLDGMGGGGSNVYEFNATSRQTTINADNVEDGKRVSNYHEFTTEDSDVVS